MKLGRVLLLILLLFALGSLGLGPVSVTQVVAQISPEHLALSFVLSKMMNEHGGIYTQYQNIPNPQEDLAVGHEILLQNTGLFMLYAVRVRDRQLFDQQVKVIKDYFLEERLGLLYWKLGAEMQPSLSSWGTHSNDPGNSLQVVEALLLAHDIWGDESYGELALKIGEGLEKYNIAPDKTLRYFSSWTPSLKPVGYGDKVVLAQLDFGAMARLAQQDRSWEEFLAINLEIAILGMTDQGLFYQSYLPEQRSYEKGEGSMIQMAQIAYYLAAYGHSFSDPAAKEAARKFLDFVKGEYAAIGKILGRYDPETGTATVTWENIAVYALIAQIALKLEDLSFVEEIMAKILSYQQLDLQSPVYGAFTVIFNDAYAFDTLLALLALASRGDSVTVTDKEPIRAVWYIGWKKEDYLQPNVIDELRQIQAKLCPNYIGLFVIAYQEKKISSNPRRDPARTASDEALRQVISQIHRLGMGVILLPVLLVDDGTWEGAIMPEDIGAWFEHWREILLHYAKLAEEMRVEILLLGSELTTLQNRMDEWNRLIVAVRSRYHGKLSYSANFWVNRHEYGQVLNMAQWRYMDYIGITGYFELTNKTNPSIEELEAAWHHDRNGQDVLADLEALSSKYGKPIVFWEIGYQSKDGTNMYPWNFPRPGEEDEREQADAWAAFLNVFRNIEWFKGYGIYAEHVGLPRLPKMYTVLGKLAEGVLARDCSK